MSNAAPETCTHGAPIESVTTMFTWYADNCAITRAAAARGEQPKPRTIIGTN